MDDIDLDKFSAEKGKNNDGKIENMSSKKKLSVFVHWANLFKKMIMSFVLFIPVDHYIALIFIQVIFQGFNFYTWPYKRLAIKILKYSAEIIITVVFILIKYTDS